MRYLFGGFILFFVFGPLQLHARMADLEYTFQQLDTSSLRISVTFKGSETGSTLLRLPDRWAGQVKLYMAVSQLRALSAGVAIDSTAKPDVYLLKYKPGSLLKLSYVLRRDWGGPVRYPLYFRPVIFKDYFFIEGYSGLVYPDMSEQKKLSCRLAYRGFAPGDFLGNSFFSNDSSETIKTTLAALKNSIFCAGKFRQKMTRWRGRKIVTAITGKFAFDDEAMFRSINGIIIHERKFWHDKGTAYFFTVLMDMPAKDSYGGTAHYQSFNMFIDTAMQLDNGPLELISHEYFHNWLGQGLTAPQPAELYYWFTEGFTDYYSLKLLYAGGILSKRDYIRKLNKKFKDYYLSPVFNYDNRQLVGRYWEDNEVKDLPYRRGLAIAFILDTYTGDRRNGGLDALLRDMYQASKPTVFSEEKFDKLATRYSDVTVLAAIREACRGHNKELTSLFINCRPYPIRLDTVNQVFAWGFDMASTKKNRKITALKPGSNAEKAGITENMEITGRISYWTGGATKAARVEVVVNGKKKWLTFFPSEKADILMPQIIVD